MILVVRPIQPSYPRGLEGSLRGYAGGSRGAVVTGAKLGYLYLYSNSQQTLAGTDGISLGFTPKDEPRRCPPDLGGIGSV